MCLLPKLYERAAKLSEEMTENNFRVFFPKGYLAAGLTFIVLFALPFILFIFHYSVVVLIIFLAVFGTVNILCLYACYVVLRKIIVVNGDEIIYRPIFGKTKHFTFSDISKGKIYILGFAVYSANGKKLFGIGQEAAGYKIMIRRVESMGVEIIKGTELNFY